MQKQSKFSKVPLVPLDKIFFSVQKFKESKNPDKMNVSIGALLDEEGELLQYKCVNIAEKKNHEANLNKEYPPITGLPEFTSSLQNLFFSPEDPVVKEERIISYQPITGGASLRVCAEVIAKFLPKRIHLSNETFGPYKNIFTNLEICHYPYFNHDTKKLDIDALIEYLNKIDSASIINFQLSSHNPTALDPSQEEWERISEIMKSKKHFALFDVAYLGYGTGSIQDDLYPIHTFANKKIEMFICYSSGKNFFNYSDDIGGLLCVLNNKSVIERLRNHIIVISRSLFSFGSVYGSRIIASILNDGELKNMWMEEQKSVVDRLKNLRMEIVEELEKQGVPLAINCLRNQRGVYMFLDLTEKQVSHLADKYGIVMIDGGRVNISGIPRKKIGYFVNALKETLQEFI